MAPARTADADLVEAARRGDRDAYAELWRRHAASARTVAVSHSSFDADDLVAEAFTRVYDAIRAGGGPNGAFRPYLFTTIRNTAASWGRARRETSMEALDQLEDPTTSETAALESLDRSTTAQAFRALPTRWQEVLWYCEVERMSPAQVAPLVGMSANATAALAYRAREGLRQEWIRAHLRGAAAEPECAWTIDRLGAYTRGRLRSRDTAKLEAHLDGCARCTIVAAEAREVGSRLALVLLPLAAGAGAATAYSAWLQQGAPVAQFAAGAAGAAGAVHAAGDVVVAGAAGSGGAASGGASVGTGAAAAGSTSGGGLAAVGAGAGTLALAAAAVAAIAVMPMLVPAPAEPPSAEAASPAVDAEAPAAIALPAPAPSPAPPAPVPADEVLPAEPALAVPIEAPPAAPAESATPPAPPVDAIALPPVVTLVDTAGGLVDPIVSGTAEAGATVTVTASSGGAAQAVADAGGAWSAVLVGLPAGSVEITAVQTDVAGNRSAPSAPVAIALSAPSLAFTALGAWLDTVFTGVPGATVQILADGVPIDEVVLDDRGTAVFEVLAPANHTWSASVRYVVDDRTGPAATAVRG
ncbi:sigma-70 family RNA polymerase sigma factor [Agromyces aurantiacus]|uniref:Sigma-70 family RNA polymerase sigma factor n=1 Tax=Agromyces aurantiacus TaxID=165814 RepID=A0ABV9R027_9MICO|nr:sigma-70 family RNA polymerase sigma factor [Agromyces aurantiacus]MBM7505582.1 RNA polymerase sigma factor (sigma-70 family) [Agromyces aurantiacus]